MADSIVASERIKEKIDSRSTKDILLELLNEFENCCREFFENVSKAAAQVIPRNQPDDNFSSRALDKLIEKHNKIQSTARIAQEQHNRYSEILKAKDELTKKNQEILQLHSLLNETEQLLSNALFQAKKKHAAIEKASKNKITSEELIKYAHRISSSCAVEAPPNWMPGDPRRPYPLDIEMRSGWLGQLQERMVTGSQELDNTEPANQTFNSEQEPLSNSSSVVLNGHTTGSDATNFGTPTWRSALNTATNVDNSLPHSGFLGSDSQVDIHNGLIGSVHDELEQMSTSSSSTSSDSP